MLGGGGYVAGPMVLAARLRGIPAALTEADAHLGLANRLAAPFARRVFLAYEIPGRTGAKVPRRRPADPGAHRGAAARRRARALRASRRRAGRSLVFGGSPGRAALNEFASTAWGDGGPAVLHVCGERDYDVAAPRVHRPGLPAARRTPTTSAQRCAAADLAVSRAGGTVWELAAAGMPAILVPYPFATADHQTLNARYFERGGGAIVVPEAELDRVPALVARLLDDPARLAAMRERDARARAARRGRRDRRGAGRPCGR